MDQLPREIIDYVLSFVDQNTKQNLRQTCTALFDMVDHRHFTIYFAQSERLSKMIKVFSRYNKPISLIFTKTISLTPKAINKLSKLTNLIELSIDRIQIDKEIKKEKGEMMGLDRLTNLQQLKFKWPIDHIKHLPSLNQLTQVTLSTFSDEDVDWVAKKGNLRDVNLGYVVLTSTPKITNISTWTSLKVKTCAEEQASEVHISPMVTQASSLKSLVLICDGGGMNSIPIQLSALTNLEYLRTLNYTVEDIERCVGLTSLKVLGLDSLLMKDCSTLTNLKKLELSLNAKTRHEERNFNFLSTLSKLKDLSITNNRQELSGLVNLLPNNLTSLVMTNFLNANTKAFKRFVKLNKLKLGVFFDVTQFDFTFLDSLTNLTKLIISKVLSSVCGTLTCVSRLTNLKALAVVTYYGQDCTPLDITKLPNLERITLPRSPTKTSGNLSEWPKLTYLEIGRGLSLAQNISQKLNLRSLHVYDTPSDEFWQNLVHLTTLEELTIGLPISPEKLEIKAQETKVMSLSTLHHLTRLRLLRISNINVKCFTHLTSLQQLIVKRHKDGGIDIMQFQKVKKSMPYFYHYEDDISTVNF